MYRYALINCTVLTIVSLVVAGLWLRHRFSFSWRRLAVGLACLLLLTVVFDSLLIALDVFRFDPARILGLRIIKAPLEDLLYSIVSLLLVGGLWQYLEQKGDSRDS